MTRAIAALCCVPVLALASQGEPPVQNLEANSLLLEEAYNVEAGEVECISTFKRNPTTGEQVLTVSQDWAIGGRHQAGLATTYGRADRGARAGVGDTTLNYRYQLAGGDDGFALAPRVSLSWPTGVLATGLGTGGIGLAVNLPASVRMGHWGAAHLNVGGGVTPAGRNLEKQRESSGFAAGGANLIWAPHAAVNVLLEAQVTREWAAGAGSTHVLFSPGVRTGFELGAAKVVLAVGMPFGLTSGDRNAAVVAYVNVGIPTRWPGDVAAEGDGEPAAEGPRRMRQAAVVAQAGE